MSRLVQHIRPGSLAYIISDFRGLNIQVENHLAKLARHCDVVLIQVYDPLESSLPEKGRYRFTDKKMDVVIDTGDRQRLTKYHERFHQHQQKLQNLAKKSRMAFFQCSTVEDPIQKLR